MKHHMASMYKFVTMHCASYILTGQMRMKSQHVNLAILIHLVSKGQLKYPRTPNHVQVA